MIRNVTTLLGVLAVAATLIPGVHAADIFVSPKGDDLNAGTSSAKPLRTIKAASTKAQPGDIVQLMGGNYSEAIVPQRSGAPGKPIVYRSYESAVAVITHSTRAAIKSAIDITDKSYITIDNIDVNGVRPGPDASINHFATLTRARHVVIRNGDFRYANGWHAVGVRGGSSHITIEDNTFDHIGVYDNGESSNSDYGDGIEIRSLTSDPAPSHVLIQRNVLKHSPHDLLRVQGVNCVIQDNTFDNSYRDLHGGNAGGRAVSLLGKDNVIQRNYFTGSGASSDASTNALIKVEGVGNIVRHNVLAYGQAEAIMSEAGEWSEYTTHMRIYQNTLYSLGGAAWRMRLYDSGKGVGEGAFINNLVVDSRKNPGSSAADADLIFVVSLAGKGATANTRVAGNYIAPAGDKAAMAALVGFDGALDFNAAATKHGALFNANTLKRAAFSGSLLSKIANFDLRSDSPGVDAGVFLTTVVGSGTGNKLRVVDSRFFTHGYGLVPGDVVQLKGSTERATITALDRASHTLTLSTALSHSDGQGIALAYQGSAPDVGAREAGAGGPIYPPRNIRARK